MARKDRIAMVKRDTPKLVRLRNGRTFYARYKRTKRTNLPAWWQSRQVAAAANQQGWGIGDFFRVAKKIAQSKIARNIGKKALEYLPDVYKNLSGKIKNKELKKIFDSDSIKKLVRYGLSYGQNKLEKIFFILKDIIFNV